MFGAIELGGTRAAVTVGLGPDDCEEPVFLETADPETTLSGIAAALRKASERSGRKLAAVGLAAFGPLDLDPGGPGYGKVLPTPKPGWSGVDLKGELERRIGAPVAMDTDVNAAALGEGRWGAARGLGSHAYVTVGTGVGVGLAIAGRPVHGLLHPEGGHIPMRRDPQRDPFPGCCPWHGDCLEGLVSGVALHKRLGRPAETLDPADPAWDLVGRYLGEGLATLSLIASPERIILGGGVGRRPEVLEKARAGLAATLNGYVGRIDASLDRYLQPPGLGAVSGLMGAFVLAEAASTTG